MSTRQEAVQPVPPVAYLGADNPESWECDVLLRDGATMHLRALRSSDREQLNAMHERSSERTHYRRFFSAMPHLNEELLERLTNVDQSNRVAIVCENTNGICAVGRYDRTPGSASAEVAFTIDDMNQGRGIGTLLLDHLVAIATKRGIERFDAYVLAENAEMLGMFRRSGFAVSTTFDDPGVRLVTIDLHVTPAAVQARYDREAVAVVASVKRCFEPNAIAVIGATETVGSPGHQLVANLVAAQFPGKIFPINPRRTTVCGLRSFASVTDVKLPIDLAIVAVPVEQVEAVLADCASAHVGALVIVSAGFAELGTDGANRQDRLLRLARRSGMRVIGPNCLGIANMSPTHVMNATFASLPLPQGSIGVMTQSGAVGIELLHELGERGLGVSSFASVGNKADVSGNDLLTYWEHDSDTKVIALYLESFGNPSAFARIAPRVSRLKPVLAIKSGRTAAAALAATSHTAALTLPDRAVGALLSQSGVIRLNSVDELVDVCAALDSQPLPAGRRLAIVTNAGGPAILAADVCEAAGVELASLADETRHLVGELLGRSILEGPIDLRADASPDTAQRVISAVANDPNVDAVVVIVADVSGNGTQSYAVAVDQIRFDGPRKPVFCSFVPSTETLREGVTLFHSAERAIRTLGYLCERRDWLDESQNDGECDQTGVAATDNSAGTLNIGHVRRLVDSYLAEHPDGGWMPTVSAFELVASSGIPVLRPEMVTTVDAAVAAANRAGYPVALKVGSEKIGHRTDRSGVHLNLRNSSDVTRAYQLLESLFGTTMGGCLVQPMSESGVELLAGIVRDRHLGPMVVVGEGGTLTELRNDSAVRRPPLSRNQATKQLRSLMIARLLPGFRGRPAVDDKAIVDVLWHLGRLAECIPEVSELDINPLIARTFGVSAVDVKIKLVPVHTKPNDELRVLRNPG